MNWLTFSTPILQLLCNAVFPGNLWLVWRVIDVHHHFWQPARGDYGWITADDVVLSRCYAPKILQWH